MDKSKIFLILFLFKITFQQEEISLSDSNPYKNSFKIEGTNQLFKVTASDIKNKYIQIKTNPQSNKALIYIKEGSSDEPDFSNHDYASIQLEKNIMYIPSLITKSENIFQINIICLNNCDFNIEISTKETMEINIGEQITFYSSNDSITDDITIRQKEPKGLLSINAIAGRYSEIKLSLNAYINNTKKEELYFNETLNGKGIMIKEYELSPDGSEIVYKGKIASIIDVYVIIDVRVISTPQLISPFGNSIYGFFQQIDFLRNGDCVEINNTIKANKFRVSAISDNNININIIKTLGSNPEKSYKFNSFVHNYFDIEQNYIDEGYKYICVKGESNSIINYIMQITDISDLTYSNYYVDPFINGFIYKDELKKNEIRQYRKLKYASRTSQETKYNVRLISGDIKVYIVYCDQFPNCKYSISDIESEMPISPYPINNFYSYGIYQLIGEKYTRGIQYLLYVVCNDIKDNICKYEVSFFDEDDSLLLQEDFKVSEYIYNETVFNYHININNDDVKEVIIYFHTFSGDITLDVNKEGIKKENRLFFGNVDLIKFSKNDQDLKGRYDLKVNASLNGYYNLYYQEIKNDEDYQKENVGSGITLIKNVEINKKKVLTFTHNLDNLNKSFVSQFYPINCKIRVHYKNEIIPQNGLFIQHELTSSDTYFKEKEIEYNISFVSLDESETYNNKLCYYYISSQEISDNKHVLIHQLFPINIKLNNKIQRMKFLYPHMPKEDEEEISISFNIPSQVPITSNIMINREEIDTIYFSKNKIYIIESSILSSNCQIGYECNIIIEVSSNSIEDLNKGINLEISIDSRDKNPSYLKKNLLKRDIVNVNEINYYITEISENEEGEILLNFDRGGGKLFGKIVKSDDKEDNPNWRKRINLPKENSKNLLQYDPFTKKLNYTKKDTKKCQDGCYLFIGVITKDIYQKQISSMFYSEYTIYIRHLNEDYKNEQIIEIPVNEYIFGTIEKVILDGYFDYYKFTVPYSTEKLIIEFQTQICTMYINLGEQLPKISSHDWMFVGENTINILNSEKKTKDGKYLPKDLINLTFYIAISTTQLDEIYTALYTFNIRAPTLKLNNIIQIHSDQNTICQINKDKDYCYFLLYFNSFECADNLFIHVLNTDVHEVELFGKKILIENFDKMDKSEIEKNLPKKDSPDLNFNSTSQFNKNYLYIDFTELSQKEYLLVSVYSPKKTNITFLNTLRTFVETTIPNPNTLQLFSVSSINPINLEIDKTNKYVFHIFSVEGTGKISFENKTNDNISNYYDIYGSRDSLVLLSNKDDNYLKITTEENLKVMFWNYITPELRHFTEIEFGTSGKIININNDFPMFFYTKVENEDSDINFNIFFKKIVMKNNSTDFKTVEDTFTISGYIITENYLIKMKKNHLINPIESEKIEGKYDGGTQKAKIYIKSSDIKKKETTDNCGKYLFFTLFKKGKTFFEKCEIEISNLPFTNSSSPINQYIDGMFLLNQSNNNIHYLKKERKNDKIMRIEFSTSSKEINFAFVKDINKDNLKKNTSLNFISQNYEGGKSIIYINSTELNGIYLSIFPKENQITSEKSSNYVFKYNSIKNDNYTINDIIADGNGKLNYNYISNSNELKITIPSLIENNTKKIIPAQYFIRIFKKEDLSKMTLLTTISFITETPVNLYQFSFIEKQKEISIKNIQIDCYYYITCIAKTENSELISYQSIDNPLDYNPQSNQKKSYYIYILVIIIIVLIIAFTIIFIRIKKEKDFLEEKINKLSRFGESKDDPLIENNDKYN